MNELRRGSCKLYLATQCSSHLINIRKIQSIAYDCTARQCLPLRQNLWSVYNQSRFIPSDETFMSASKSSYFLGFHWSQHSNLVSVGQHFVTTRIVHLPMDEWMISNFMSFLTVFQSYQDDERLIMKGCVQKSPVYG